MENVTVNATITRDNTSQYVGGNTYDGDVIGALCVWCDTTTVFTNVTINMEFADGVSAAKFVGIAGHCDGTTLTNVDVNSHTQLTLYGGAPASAEGCDFTLLTA